MKNLIIALSMFFAVGINAQVKKTTVKATRKAPVKEVVAAPKLTNAEKANKNLADLAAFTPLTAERKAVFLELFNTKYRMLTETAELSAERKQVVYNIIGAKLEGSLDPAAAAKVKANTALYKSLTQ